MLKKALAAMLVVASSVLLTAPAAQATDGTYRPDQVVARGGD